VNSTTAIPWSALAVALALSLPVLAQAHDEEGEQDAAHESSSSHTEAVEHLFLEGYRLFAAGEFEGAVASFREVLERQPQHRSARNYLAESLAVLSRRAQGAGTAAPLASPKPAASTAVATAKASAQARRRAANPRAYRRGSAALSLGGPTLGLGLAVQFRPHWLLAIGGGIGGFAAVLESGESALLGLFAEAQLQPVPRRLTPIVGIGLSFLAGNLVTQVDAQGFRAVGQELARVLPYILVGIRYDAPIGLLLSGGMGLVPAVIVDPSGTSRALLLPFPGFRIGMNF